MKQKQKIWAWLVLVSFIFSSVLPLGNYNIASANTAYKYYTNDGVAFYAKSTAGADSELSPVYRLYRSATTEHLYTADATEKADAIADGYVLDPSGTNGIAFYAYPDNIISGTVIQNIPSGSEPENIPSGSEPQTQTIAITTTREGVVPVYQLYYEPLGSRFYTASETEKTAAMSSNTPYVLNSSNANADGIAFYVYPKDTVSATITKENLVAVHRFHNLANGDYIYTTDLNEVDVSAKPSAFDIPSLGPEISVGLWNTSKSDLDETAFKIKANKDYNIKDNAGNILAQVTAGNVTRVDTYTITTTRVVKDDDSGGGGGGKKKKKKKKKKKSSKKTTSSSSARVLGVSTTKKTAVKKKTVKKKTAKKKTTKKKTKKKKTSFFEFLVPTAYASDRIVTTNTQYLKIRVKKDDKTILEKEAGVQELYFDSTDQDNSDMIFATYRPGEGYNEYYQYRGKMKIKYTDDSNIWMINVLPMEQYVWGMGEMAGDGPEEHSKVMTVIFRTYGKWYADYATKYLPWGFRILSTSSSQIYSGYDHEVAYPLIKPIAEETRGIIVTYKGETALTPYSSWTDGHTRSFEEHWGSKDYPWCQSVDDPYGKHPSKTTEELFASGNHMVGLSAHGSLYSARDHGWKYKNILKHYYTGIDDLTPKYP